MPALLKVLTIAEDAPSPIPEAKPRDGWKEMTQRRNKRKRRKEQDGFRRMGTQDRKVAGRLEEGRGWREEC